MVPFHVGLAHCAFPFLHKFFLTWTGESAPPEMTFWLFISMVAPHDQWVLAQPGAAQEEPVFLRAVGLVSLFIFFTSRVCGKRLANTTPLSLVFFPRPNVLTIPSVRQ